MFMVLTAAAKMPQSCWGRYIRVAVVELEPGFAGRPKMISERAIGVKRIVDVWEGCHQGKHYPRGRCAASVALREARAAVEALS